MDGTESLKLPGLLAGRVALVTGAGNGIGRATARHLAAMGATVGVNDLKPEFVEKVVEEITAAGGQAVGVVRNIASRDGMRAAVMGLAERCGRLDVIVNIASVAGLRSAPSSIVYSGIKAGVMGVTRAAAAELGGRGIRVNAIAPSAVPTEGTQRNRNAERDAKRIARTPLGRLGTVEDIARAVGFLATDQASFVTGQVLVVDGGVTTTTL